MYNEALDSLWAIYTA